MVKSVSQYRQIKAAFQQKNQSRYAAFREAIRIVIPYKWRRNAVALIRSRLGIRTFIEVLRFRFSSKDVAPPIKIFRRGDIYESITLLPHIPETEVKAILGHQVTTTKTSCPDIICCSIIDWSFRFQRPQQLMTQFAAHGHRVFYLSVSQFRSPYARPRFAEREIKENLFEVQIAANSTLKIFETVIDGKDQSLALESLDELRRAFNINEAIAYVMIPSWVKVALAARQSWGWRVIYDCMDDWDSFPGISLQSLEMEKHLVQDSDFLVVTSQRLYDKWQAYRRPMLLARNAADYDFYRSGCKPNHLLEGIKHPIAGYFGAIASWFDVDLLVEIAQWKPHLTFVLLGGVFDTDVSRLRLQPNIVLLGQQPYETMPQYLYHFDVCIIPFKINPVTEATDPVKLYEYLCGGKPVVSVDLPELEPYRDYVYLAEDAADFSRKIDLALAEDGPRPREDRKTLARRHTWSDRYRCIRSTFKEIIPRTSIIIVTYNNLALTKLCLESVFRNTEYPNYEIIVVDNNSTDGTPQFLQELNEKHDNLVIILNSVNGGFAKANNQGIRLSQGEYLVLLNNDTIVPQGWLSRLLAHISDPEIGLAGPVTNFAGNEAKIDVSYRTWAEMETFSQDFTWGHHQQIADIYMLAMFCVAMRREVYEKVGPLDEQFGIGMFEDDDYSMRVKQLGYRLICAADAFVHHFGQAAFGKLIRSGDYHQLFDENRQKYEKKWGVEWKQHQHSPLDFETHSIPVMADERNRRNGIDIFLTK
jgi:GT2 family glycosyltransferase/glycosyltransferase involved in cell wall biosynthesis